MGDGGNKWVGLLSRATPCAARGESAAAFAGQPAACHVLSASGVFCFWLFLFPGCWCHVLG